MTDPEATLDATDTTPDVRFLPPVRTASRDYGGKSGGSRYVSSALVWALCPRCSFRYRLNEMKEEVYDQRPTGRRVCPECWDKDDPHLEVNRIDLTDAGLVLDPLPHPEAQSIGLGTGILLAQWDLPVTVILGTATPVF